MSIVNIISAIGNNSSIWPLFVRDCLIENPTKVGLTYKQNRKDSLRMAYNASRERSIDEYATSAVWLGGIPLMNKICDFFIKKFGYNPEINPKLFKESKTQGIKYNFNKFKNMAPEESKDLLKVLQNESAYKKLLIGKFILSTGIPIALMGFCLPKLNFKLTDKIKQKQEAADKEKESTKNIAFKGIASAITTMSTVNKMAITDCGLTVGRVKTGRNKNEKAESGFKMLGGMFLNYVAPIWIAFGLNKLAEKLFKTNVNLDPILLYNAKEELADIKLPNDNIIEFLDKNPDSNFAKLCKKYCGVKYIKNGIRDPRVYLDENKLNEFKNEIEKFLIEAKANSNLEQYAKKALRIKSANILTNVCLSSFLLAVGLPKVTFFLRELVTGKEPEPGLIE